MDYLKALKRLISFFLLNPVPFNRQSYRKKRGLELGTSRSSGYKTSSSGYKNSFSSYILSDQVWWYNLKWFLSYFKNSSANLCKLIHDIINYSTFICPFESGKCGKEGKKLQKFEYLENKKSFLDEIKNIFHSFWRAIIWCKNENLIKNSRHKLPFYR